MVDIREAIVWLYIWPIDRGSHILLSIPVALFLGVGIGLCSGALLIVKLFVHIIDSFNLPDHIRGLRRKLWSVTDQDQYECVAKSLDKVTGKEDWKSSPEGCDGYNGGALERTIARMREHLKTGNMEGVVHDIRVSLNSHMWKRKLGVLNESMYSYTYIGTKYLIHEFVEEVVNALNFLIPHASSPLVQDLLNDVRASWGSTALILSGGGSLGIHHVGLLESLVREGLLPKIISGTSYGSILAAYFCTRSMDEAADVFDTSIVASKMQAFQPPRYISRFWHFCLHGNMLDMDVLELMGQNAYGDMTFQEAFEKTGRILNIAVTRADRREPVILLNKITAPSVLVRTAVMASCGFPFLIHPVLLLEKSKSGRVMPSETYHSEYFHDGSLTGDIPADALKEMWGVQYTIVSQVNPHVFPFTGVRVHGEAGKPVNWRTNWRGGFVLAGLELVLKESINHLLRIGRLLDVFPTFMGFNPGLLGQSYHGDVTIHPRRLFWNHRHLAGHLGVELSEWYCTVGKQMAFPKMPLIRNRVLVDIALEQLWHAAKAVASPTNSDLLPFGAPPYAAAFESTP